MPAIALEVEGVLFYRAEHVAFMFRPGARRYVARLGFILSGSEEVLFPESLLDDWGHEIATVELYEWVQENGLNFPRAEIFGFDLKGVPDQVFVREVDLATGYACYVSESTEEVMISGVRIDAILLPEPGAGRPRRLPRAAGVEPPLADANVEWWVVNSSASTPLDLDFLDDLDSLWAS